MAGKAVIGEAIPGDILQEYDVKETLGTGHFSKVKLGINKKTGEKVAIKVRFSADACDRDNAAAPAAAPRVAQWSEC